MIPRAQPAKADSNKGSNHSAFRLTDGPPRSALYKNIEGGYNTADGMFALFSNTNGLGSMAIGYKALLNTTTGIRNTAVGQWALYNNTTGTDNIGLGPYGLGGYDIITANHVIAIGHPGQKVSNSCWIGNIATSAVTGSAVYISSNGRLGLLSSRRFKKEIKPMDKASEAILAFKPVTFQYKSDHEIEGRRFSPIFRVHLRVRETCTGTILRSAAR